MYKIISLITVPGIKSNRNIFGKKTGTYSADPTKTYHGVRTVYVGNLLKKLPETLVPIFLDQLKASFPNKPTQKEIEAHLSYK